MILYKENLPNHYRNACYSTALMIFFLNFVIFFENQIAVTYPKIYGPWMREVCSGMSEITTFYTHVLIRSAEKFAARSQKN